jgi:ATP-binding cassette subfamily G (WHITE) protein 2 (SNQ2)
MSGPTPLQDIREEDATSAVPTLSGLSAAANQANIAHHNLLDHDGQSCIHSVSLTPSPDPSGQHPRRTSSISTEVGIGHFDLTGVEELRQTMSRISVNPQNDDVKKTEKNSAFRSDVTLTVGDGPFDFEKCLRDIVKKYSPCFYFMNTSD